MQFEFGGNQKQKKKPRYANTKRFMYGALVCFTKNNFLNLIFGKIIDRDIKFLEQGQVIVNFDNGDEAIDYEADYIMVECSTYFEPYYHVLKSLQSKSVENFPMERYIIHVDPQMLCPKYLSEAEEYKIDKYKVPIFDRYKWPTAKELELDSTQYKAFQAGLMNEFAIIQGPPGTGKTYLGLKIVKTLIRNKEYWYNFSPILIVCFTNHALDQFVEGLIDTTLDIIRVGGQSKNENMKQFSISAVRYRMNKKTARAVSEVLYQKKREVQDLANEIKRWNAELDSLSQFNTVTDFKCFSAIGPLFEESWFATAPKKEIIEWLLGGQNYKQRKIEMEKMRTAEVCTL